MKCQVNWRSQCVDLLAKHPTVWLRLSELFSMVEPDIPIHFAMRRAVLAQKSDREIGVNTARWRLFISHIRPLVERRSADGEDLTYRPLRTDFVRLLPHNVPCGDCGGPRFLSEWPQRGCARKYICHSCERPTVVPIVFPCEFTVPSDLVSVVVPELWAWDAMLWESINVRFIPSKPKRNRHRKRRFRPLHRPVRPPVAPPVLVKTPKKLKPEPTLPTPNPVPTLSVSLKDIWREFLSMSRVPVPPFDDNPKLRRMLHRALEAGVVQEYKLMTESMQKELKTLRWPDVDQAANLIGMRAIRWMETTLGERQRRRWALILMQAYSSGALAIVALVINGRLNVISFEVDRLIKATQPKTNRQPQPVRQRWGSPIRHARNVVSRWFNR